MAECPTSANLMQNSYRAVETVIGEEAGCCLNVQLPRSTLRESLATSTHSSLLSQVDVAGKLYV
jgi:hypothetical protein